MEEKSTRGYKYPLSTHILTVGKFTPTETGSTTPRVMHAEGINTWCFILNFVLILYLIVQHLELKKTS